MKRILFLFLLAMSYSADMFAQCSVCARTTEQLDSSSAEKFNFAVIYLMIAPLAIIGVTGYLWYKRTYKSETKA